MIDLIIWNDRTAFAPSVIRSGSVQVGGFEVACSQIAGGIAATMVAMEVIMMGRSRIGQAVKSDSSTSLPWLRTWLVKSTSKMEFFFTIPIKRMTPMML